ncbi:MAG: flagellar hook protein [Caldibacillus debilis]|uniref:Flagellar hook-associated protein 2 n=2 Tax=Caldibacillus debilis TaxID=301148 RepID=A0A3E0K2X3_9BACI|nr:flagellar hook protein [Bacillaceae bacterium]OUM83909.1 MAG: hypothetical protein BAA03_08945 [Caldibacillus debilis]REJ27621.1 MAG: flagellar hook protein [Caldibacillus debilis]
MDVNMRISGLVSGIDVDQMVKDLMKAERIPLNKLYQQKQYLEWQRDAYREVNSLLLSLRDAALNLRLSQTFKGRKVTSSNENLVTATAAAGASSISYTIQKVSQLASAAYKISAGSLSKSASQKIDPAKSLYAQMDLLANGDKIDWKMGGYVKETISLASPANTVELSHLAGNVKWDAESIENMEIIVNGKTYRVVTDPGQLNDQTVYLDLSGEKAKLQFNTAIQGSVQAGYFVNELKKEFTVPQGGGSVFSLSPYTELTGNVITVRDKDGNEKTFTVVTGKDAPDAGEVLFDSATGRLTFSESLAEGSVFSVGYQTRYFSFGIQTYNEQGEAVKDIITVDASASLNVIISEINKSSAGVVAVYDSFTDQITLTRAKTGNFNNNPAEYGGQEIVTIGAFLNDVLQFGGVPEYGGENAKFMINGLETERFANSFTIDGVTFTLKGTFDAAQTGSPVTISVTTDVDAVYENIKAFVDKYNEIITKINAKLLEKRYRDFPPLTDEQKKEMKEQEIQLWEEKAKSGLLRSDPILSGALNSFRLALYGKVENASVPEEYKFLFNIGITTSTDYSERGILVIDEKKLKEAIEKNPDAVYNLFAATGQTDSEKGIAQRLTDSVDRAMNAIYEKAGKAYWTEDQYTIGRILDDLNDRIDRFEDRMMKIEARYYRQFTAMEQAILRSNQQSMYLMQMFGGYFAQ